MIGTCADSEARASPTSTSGWCPGNRRLR